MSIRSESKENDYSFSHPVAAVVSSLAASVFREGQDRLERELTALSDSELLKRANEAEVFLSEKTRSEIIANLQINESIPSIKSRTEV